MASEKLFENKIKKFLQENGGWFVKYFANRNTKSGIPDLLACINGVFVAIEVKGENGKPSPLQIWNKKKIREAGGIAIILYPSQFEQFKQMISEINQGLIDEWIGEQIIFDKNNAISN